MDRGIDQVAYWNGEVGERWARNRRALDGLFAPLTEALLAHAAPRPGSRLLDIGCGAGEIAMLAANRLGGRGRVVAADVSAPLLAAARSRVEGEAAGGAPIAWIEADAETHDFGDAVFECDLSRFGVMFFSDSVAAFANIRRALVPGSRLVFLCWRAIDENPWVHVPREAVLPLIPDPAPPPGDAPGPFRFADRARLEGILAAAGFRDVACTALDRPLVLGQSSQGSAQEAAEAAAEVALELGPVSRLLREADPALREAARAAVMRALLPHAEAGAIMLGAACWLVSATR